MCPDERELYPSTTSNVYFAAEFASADCDRSAALAISHFRIGLLCSAHLEHIRTGHGHGTLVVDRLFAVSKGSLSAPPSAVIT